MATATKDNPDLAAILDDVATLKRDVAALLAHLQQGARSGAEGVAAELSDEARRVYDSLAAQGERSAKAIIRHVDEQPIMSLLIAFGIGFIGGRLLSR